MINLFLCPVCKHASPDFCNKRLVSEAQKECEFFEYSGVAAWIFNESCPECMLNESNGMLYQDRYGATCAVSGCKFNQYYPGVKSIPHVISICGSLNGQDINKILSDERLEGSIIVYVTGEETENVMKSKIDMSNEIFVISIGCSEEIAYAKQCGKDVSYWIDQLQGGYN